SPHPCPTPRIPASAAAPRPRASRPPSSVPRSTVDFRRHRDGIPSKHRPASKQRGPQGPCSDEELVGHIRRILTESPFHDEGYRKVWVRFRYRGVRTSKERVRRPMREQGQVCVTDPRVVKWGESTSC